MDVPGLVLLAIGGGCLLLMGYVCSEVKGGVRDRVLAILAMGVLCHFLLGRF